MKPHNPELISALLDGELKGLRLWRVKRHVGRCAVCAAEYRHLSHVRTLLAANRIQPQMSDSADFFWSKIKREIQADAHKKAVVPVPRLSLLDWVQQRQTVVAVSALVAIAAIGLTFVTMQSNNRRRASYVASVETTIPHTSATAFESNDSDGNDDTVIWVSGLPWTKDMKEMQTVYANLDS